MAAGHRRLRGPRDAAAGTEPPLRLPPRRTVLPGTRGLPGLGVRGPAAVHADGRQAVHGAVRRLADRAAGAARAGGGAAGGADGADRPRAGRGRRGADPDRGRAPRRAPTR
ncbi:hypothetical protein ACFSTC_29945 [Nonomuraea ferruginea]